MTPKSALFFALAASACTVTPDDDPWDLTLSAACEACLQGDGGSKCGALEADCSADTDCESALICALGAHCFDERADPECVVERGCEPQTTDGAERFGAMETCARTTCADSCNFGEAG
jgi:hypothetical protein